MDGPPHSSGDREKSVQERGVGANLNYWGYSLIFKFWNGLIGEEWSQHPK